MANINDLLGSLDEQGKEREQQQDKAAQLDAVTKSGDKVAGAVDKNAQSTAEGLKNIQGEVKVSNPTDVSEVVNSINKLNLTTFMQNEGLPQLAKNLDDLSGKTQDLQDKLENEGLKKMSDQLSLVVKKLDEVSKTISNTEISVDSKLQKTIDNLSKSINAIDFNPSVNVSAPQTKVVTTPIDLGPISEGLSKVVQAIKDSESGETEEKIDLSPVTIGLSEVQSAIQALRFPVSNYVLPFKDSSGKAVQVQLDASGNIPTSSGGGGGGGAVTIADGADTAEGATTDTAVTAGSAGTVSGKLRQISSDISTGNTALTTIASNTAKLSGNSDTIQGENIAVTAPGNQLVSLAGPTGDAIDTVNDSLSVNVANTGSVVRGNPNQSAQVNVPARLEVPFSTSVVQPVAFTDVSNYRWVSVHLTASGTASVVTWQTSNDGINWLGMGLVLSSNLGATIGVVSGSTLSVWDGPLHGRYFRLSVTGITAGVTQGVVEFFASPSSILQTTSNIATISGTPSDAAAASTSLWVENFAELYNGTTFDRQRSVQGAVGSLGTGSTGLGVLATGSMAQFNNAINITAGTYAPLQLDAQGNLKITAASGKALSTDKTTIAGIDIATSADGTQLVSLAGPTGDAIDTKGDALSVSATSSTSTGITIPGSAFYNGISDQSGKLIGTVSANTASNTSGNGLLGTGQMVFDGTNWQKQPADSSGVPKVNNGASPSGTTLNTYSVHITSNTTTTPIASTAYISMISISNEVGGTTSTITIQDKQGTPLKLINGVATTALTTAPTVINFQNPAKMVSGIDIITAGAVAATVDVWIDYFA